MEKEVTLTRDLDDQRRELKVPAATGEVVTQAEVVASRVERDRKWTDLRRTHLDGDSQSDSTKAGSLPPQAPFASAFEAAIREADRLADLLRADTERATTPGGDATAYYRHAGRDAAKRGSAGAPAGKRRDLQHRWRPRCASSSVRPPAGRPSGMVVPSPATGRTTRGSRRVCELSAERSIPISPEPATFWIRRCWQVTGCLTPDESAAGAFARAQQAVNAARKARADRDSVTEQTQAGTAELRDLCP